MESTHISDDAFEDDYPTCAMTYVTLRLYGDVLDPSIITAKLGIEPSYSAKKGELRQRTANSQRKLYWKTGAWGYATKNEVKSNDLEKHIKFLLDKLEPVKDQFFALIEKYDLEADLFAFWVSRHGHGGPEFSPKIMCRISTYNLPLGIDVYFADEDEE